MQALSTLSVIAEQQAPDLGERYGGMLRLMVEGSLRYAIAHEYGHVVIDATASARGRPRDFDAELEADMQALQTIPSAQVLPLSDTLLFLGRVLLENAEIDHTQADGPHEPTVCRARRSTLMRERLIPPLLRISALRSSRRLEGAGRPNAMPAINLPKAAASCPPGVGRRVEQIERDLLRIEAFMAGLPARSATTLEQWSAVGRLPLATQIGISLRNAIAIGAVVERVTDNGNLLATASDVVDRNRRLRELEDLERDPRAGDLPSREFRTLLYGTAMGRFFSAPPGSSFVQNAEALDRRLTEADLYGAPEIETRGVRALSLFLSGRCDAGYATLAEIETLRAAFDRTYSGELASIAPRPKDLPSVLVPLDRLRGGIGGGTAREAGCTTLRGNVAAGLKASLGWTD
jgi:hypothetical protein